MPADPRYGWLDGACLVDAAQDKTIKVWDMNESKMSMCLTEHDYHVRSIVYAGETLYSASKYGPFHAR